MKAARREAAEEREGFTEIHGRIVRATRRPMQASTAGLKSRDEHHRPCVVSLTWTLTDAQNAPSTNSSSPSSSCSAARTCCPRSRKRSAGQDVGFETHLHLEPEHAFGDYHSEYVCFEDRALFPDTVEAGMQFEGLPDGAVTPDMPPDAIYTVTEVYPSHVVLDGEPPARRHRAAPAPEGARRAARDARGDRRRQRRRRRPWACCRSCRRPIDRSCTEPRRRRRVRADQCFPVEPKPPAAAIDGLEVVDRRNVAWTTGTMTICAMRSIG
jgi:FKBP-type peptidyl-prolyl cis-trans isomerase SlyD